MAPDFCTAPRAWMLSAAIAAAMAMPAWAQSPPSSHRFEIPQQDLATALEEFGRQSGKEILYDLGLVSGLTGTAVSCECTPSEALAHLLDGTRLRFNQVNTDTFVVEPLPGQGGVGLSPPATTAGNVVTTETVTVTGTRIRGAATPSPVISIGETQVREGGFKDLGEVIRSIPQNFGGGQNPGVAIGATAGGLVNQNSTSGSALNLRGIGPDATLTLLNGKRLSYSGFMNAVDISVIPVAALSRIEVIADGASAIYGSDAVAGVANVITKREFDGVTASYRIGTATDGGGTDRRYGLTTGKVWRDGGFIAAYEYMDAQPIAATERGYLQYMQHPHVIMPDQRQHSAFASAHQAMGDNVTLSVDAIYGRRHSQRMDMQSINLWDRYVYTKNLSIYPTLEVLLPADWSMSIGGGYAKDEVISYIEMTPYAAGSSNPPTGATTVPSHVCMCNQGRLLDLGFEGPVARLASGDARLAVGAGYRSNDFEWRYYSAGSPTKGDRSSRYAYGELYFPLVSPAQGRSGAHRLDVTLAARYEDYADMGSVTTPKFGVVYQPSASFTLKGSWGESYKVPNLTQAFQPVTTYLYNVATLGIQGYPSNATAMLLVGGNPNLLPEQAKSRTVSLLFHPQQLPGLQAELGYFDITYTDRIVSPLPTPYGATFINPVYQEFIVQNPSPAVQQQAVDLASGLLTNASGAPYDPERVIGILYNMAVNMVSQRISGLDLSASYERPFMGGGLTLRGSATWLDVRQQNVSSQPEREVSGLLFYPASLRARAGVVWQRQGMTLSSFLNHVGSASDVRLAQAERLTSHTTLDVNARYGLGPEYGFLSGVELALSVHNLLDRTPPLFRSLSAFQVNYDSTNHSAVGRFIGLSVSKYW